MNIKIDTNEITTAKNIPDIKELEKTKILMKFHKPVCEIFGWFVKNFLLFTNTETIKLKLGLN